VPEGTCTPTAPKRLMIKVHSDASVQGGRASQDDSYVVLQKVCVLSDGLGGHQKGNVASQTAVSFAANVLGSGGTLSAALFEAAEAVDALRTEPIRHDNLRKHPGTTFLAASWNDSTVTLLSIGDSLVWLIRDGNATCLAGKRDSYLSGELRSCLGGGYSLGQVRLHGGHSDIVELAPGDFLALTTDGCDLWFSEDRDYAAPFSAQTIVEDAVAINGAKADNATCVLLQCE
jgi:serine/threonine protein phosphatase PrpC